MSLKLYVGNLKNKWVDTKDFSYASDFWKYCSEIQDEEDPKFDIQDFAYDEDWEKTLWNHSNKDVDEYYKLLDKMQSMNLDHNPELFSILCQRDFTKNYVVYQSMDNFLDAILMAKCNYNFDIFYTVKSYIDRERIKSDLITDYDVEVLSDGRVVDFS